MKSFENTFETPKVPCMLDMTGKSLFPTRLETKKILKIFLKNFFLKIFLKKLRKRRIVPKNEKGGPFGIH